MVIVYLLIYSEIAKHRKGGMLTDNKFTIKRSIQYIGLLLLREQLRGSSGAFQHGRTFTVTALLVWVALLIALLKNAVTD